jgi:peroxiredoxin
MAYGPLRQKRRSGSAAPGFALADETGRRWTLERLLVSGQPVLLVFSQPGCAACLTLLPDLREWQSRLGNRLTVAVVSQGPGRAGPTSTIRQAAYPTLSDPEGSVASAYGVTATPSATLIERDGGTVSDLALGAGEIAELVRTRSLADESSRFPRRTAIARAARGAATLGAFPLVAAACGSTKPSSQSTSSSTTSRATTSGRPAALHIGDQYICRQTYALCTNAPCVPSPHDPNIVMCDCVVKPGYSIGFTPCPKRAPHGKTLYSEFSTELATSGIHAMTCPAHVPWANCVDSICELDPTDPDKARCQCALVKTGPSFTFGGDCNTKTCGTTVWSGAHSGLGGSQVAAAMKRVGQPLVYPAPCPKS